jgi:predicted DNA-binding protein
MSKTTITKSIRLSPAESEELTQLSERTSIAEATLMKKWVQEGIRTQKLELAIRAYMERKTDLRGGAAMAGVSYNRFLQELQGRNIVVLDDDRFLDRLTFLAEAFDDETLQAVVRNMVEKQSSDLATNTTD